MKVAWGREGDFGGAAIDARASIICGRLSLRGPANEQNQTGKKPHLAASAKQEGGPTRASACCWDAGERRWAAPLADSVHQPNADLRFGHQAGAAPDLPGDGGMLLACWQGRPSTISLEPVCRGCAGKAWNGAAAAAAAAAAATS